MDLKSGVTNLMPPEDAKQVAGDLSRGGWKVVLFPDGITDGAGFVAALNAAGVPLDPPKSTVRVWWALLDSLVNGLDQLQDTRVAFVWPDTISMKKQQPADFDEAIHLLEYLARSGPDWARNGAPSDLLVILGTS